MRQIPVRSLLLAVITGPALAQDPAGGDAAFGRELYESLCIQCHHESALGDDRAPDIRGATIPAIRRGTSGMDSMQDFYFEDEDIAAMHAYLATLAD